MPTAATPLQSQPLTTTAAAADRPAPPRPVRRVENGRLVYYQASATADFWDAHWSTRLTPQHFAAARQGSLGFFEDIFPRHLPRPGRILEAGCGPGQLVLALRKRRYDCEGVDYTRQTVERVRELVPDLPIRWGDVRHLDVPDAHYAACISLGVVEHVRDGPEPFLRESHRVLTDDGVLLVSVPHFNLLRRWKARLGLYGGVPGDRTFYQYAFAPAEMTRILRACGFRVECVYGYDPWKGLKDEVPGTLRLFAMPRIGPRIERAWRGWAWARRHVGHMILYVCRKG